MDDVTIASGERLDLSPDRHAILPAGEAVSRARGVALGRGVSRTISGHGYACLSEVTLQNGRRADILALDGTGTIIIIEIKSSVEDFRGDRKWPEYREFCDQLYFAVPSDFPIDLIPEQCGLLIADPYGAEFIRPALVERLSPARRKAMTLRFAQLAALRLQRLLDPNVDS
jgi:hypothetical protein